MTFSTWTLRVIVQLSLYPHLFCLYLAMYSFWPILKGSLVALYYNAAVKCKKKIVCCEEKLNDEMCESMK